MPRTGQLTRRKDGMAMGCAFNHVVLEGTSTWHSISSWSQACNGSPSVSAPPLLDWTKSRNTRVKLDLSQPPDPKSFHQSNDRIKSTVNSALPSDDSQAFSTFQSLSAHIWRHVIQARCPKPEDVTVCTVCTKCRNHVDPPMPEAIFTGTATGLILGHPPSFGASMIQKAIASHDAAAIHERNKQWEAAHKIFQFKDAGANCVAVGSSPRFKVYEVNLGWGKPEGIRSGSNNRFDGMVYLCQGKSSGRSIDVEISLEAGTTERLEMEKAFLLD